ncbi:ATP-dependent DNA ligase [Candidatus Parcubacteria bacterium]|nr:MAG: ATP-dependent DNA ligase [Candidatus Parcubacteria bacterium]
MLFKDLSVYLQKLEKTTSRNTMVEILAELFDKTPTSVIDKVVYLLQGRVAPLYVAVEFGMADRMIVKAITKAYGLEEEDVSKMYKQIGDLGEVAEELSSKFKVQSSKSIGEVFEILKKIAETGGVGSVEKKVDALAKLFEGLDSLSVRYVARIPVDKLRLGFSDMTVLDSFSWMLCGSKNLRSKIEKAYNVRSDLGDLAKIIKEKGVEALEGLTPAVFVPILMARAERLSSGEEIIGKIGRCAVEPKVDGFRLQAHYKKSQIANRKSQILEGGEVKLYTRNLEDSTFMYPDLVEAVKRQVKVDEAIFEGEAIAYDIDSGEFLPFQETVQRKRKHGIEEKALQIPLRFILFDLLYKDGRSFIEESYKTRRETLEKIIAKDDVLIMSRVKVADSAKEIDNEFEDAVSRGLEGILAKRLDGVYQAGARGWNWIKLKRSYSGALTDTLDAVVMGYNKGKGKRTSFGIGAFLIGAYDEKKDKYVTIAKVGTGLTDEEWRQLYERCEKLKTEDKPVLYNVDKNLVPDVWVEPSIVVEVRADEITRSPIHTAGRVMRPSKNGEAFDVEVPGYALRFPRLERFRDDKKPEDATTLVEIEEMFINQKKLKVKS